MPIMTAALKNSKKGSKQNTRLQAVSTVPHPDLRAADLPVHPVPDPGPHPEAPKQAGRITRLQSTRSTTLARQPAHRAVLLISSFRGGSKSDAGSFGSGS